MLGLFTDTTKQENFMEKKNITTTHPRNLLSGICSCRCCFDKRQTPERCAPPNSRGEERGFTLIELLVVVLIIGILAAVAVPQYQKAVWKSRYATVKAMVNALANAEEAYYLANGEYTTDVDALGVGLAGATSCPTTTKCNYPWGRCRWQSSTTETSYVECLLRQKNDDFVGYQRNLNFSPQRPAQTYCYDYQKGGISQKVCQSETGKSNPDISGSVLHAYSYP